jgi:glutamate N-acetyltransferase / amino-acid N-acetyltransferase
MKQIDGRITAPKGFKAAGIRCGIKQAGKDLALIYSDKLCNAAAVFTTNAFKAASVIINQQKIKCGKAQAVIINSGNANACTGEQGLIDAEAMCSKTANYLGLQTEHVLNASTGIIGQFLPMDKISKGINEAVIELSYSGWKNASEAIITTDTYPKTIAYEFEVDGKVVRISGMCKGAGMICPNMATMLAFVTTDAKISTRLLNKLLKENIALSFNSLTIDGDMSTNDQLIILANGESKVTIDGDKDAKELFNECLFRVLTELAKLIAKDGEGATKYVEISVINAKSYKDAKSAAMTIANSPLVKTAIFGEDPNWGRVLCAAGRSKAAIDPSKTSLYFGKVKIVENGEPLNINAETARKPMLEEELIVKVDLGLGNSSATVFTCDFSYEYIKINAEYHT